MFWFGKKNKKERFINSVRIGNQVWMAENLNVDHYRNGAPIPEVRDPQTWTELTTGACCYFKNEPANGATYGKLYNWYAVNDPRGLAPHGWHIPSDEEWTQLETYLGMSQSQADYDIRTDRISGGKLKETGTAHWARPNTGATNESGFSALPGGVRVSENGNCYYCDMGYIAIFWTSTKNLSRLAWHRQLYYNVSGLIRDTSYNQRFGFSVRCVKD